MSNTIGFLRRHISAILAIALLMGGGGVAYGVAGHGGDRASSKATRIYACVKSHSHLLTRTSATKPCPKGSKKISWSIAGPAGAAGVAGAQGPIGPDGAAGATGATGPAGAQGAPGPAGADGIDGIDGIDGTDGIDGIDGTDGVDGIDGTDGTDGTDGADAVSDFAEFFALAPPDNAATVALGSDVAFPQDGPTAGGGLTRTGPSTFNLAQIGIYRVSFSVPVTEAGQLILTLNGADLAYTVVGRATGTSIIAGEALVQTTVINSLLTVRNPAGNSTALTITPLSGGARPASSTLVIERLD
ncbi:MAG: Collagen triple helix repeat protein [Nocardioides sp.]|jgi:hypothetical protein|nr:Collagen triple helix repeat protein [Nocardioides sp.]